jgi:hypothetical protein
MKVQAHEISAATSPRRALHLRLAASLAIQLAQTHGEPRETLEDMRAQLLGKLQGKPVKGAVGVYAAFAAIVAALQRISTLGGQPLATAAATEPLPSIAAQIDALLLPLKSESNPVVVFPNER